MAVDKRRVINGEPRVGQEQFAAAYRFFRDWEGAEEVRRRWTKVRWVGNLSLSDESVADVSETIKPNQDRVKVSYGLTPTVDEPFSE